jgi:hypothetical protein
MADSDGDGAAHEGAWGAGSASSFTLILHHHLHREQRHLRFAQPSFKPLPFTLFLKAAKVVLDQHKPGKGTRSLLRVFLLLISPLPSPIRSQKFVRFSCVDVLYLCI